MGVEWCTKHGDYNTFICAVPSSSDCISVYSLISCSCWFPLQSLHLCSASLFIVVHIGFASYHFLCTPMKSHIFPSGSHSLSLTFHLLCQWMKEQINMRWREMQWEGEEDRLCLVHWWHCFLEWEPPDDAESSALVTRAPPLSKRPRESLICCLCSLDPLTCPVMVPLSHHKTSIWNTFIGNLTCNVLQGFWWESKQKNVSENSNTCSKKLATFSRTWDSWLCSVWWLYRSSKLHQ